MTEPTIAADHVRIRMYRQGLGDCFLLTIPDGPTRAHVLIDCGVLKGTAEAEARMKKVAANIEDTTGGRLDLLVVTHEHWDHISGFLQAEAIFNRLTIGEVWLAWTEEPDDELAIELRERRKKAVRTIRKVANRLRGIDSMAARRSLRRLDGLMQFFGDELGATGRKTTEKAMEWVKSRNAPIRCLYPGNEARDLPGVSTVRAFVLGPPWNRKSLKKSRPSKVDSEVYELTGDSGSDLGFFDAIDDATEQGGALSPFEKWFGITKEESRSHEVLAQSYWNEDKWRQIEDDWLDAAGRLALQLDSDTNNTSLALAFELQKSGRILLFPGDAQVGNWLSWHKQSWSTKDGTGTKTVSINDLFARTVFYKVGHHGSHNATLQEQGLELMSSPELAAMIPVSRETADKMEWRMPFGTLYRRLQEKTKGRILDRDLGIPQAKPASLGEAQWRYFSERARETPDWIDYWIEL